MIKIIKFRANDLNPSSGKQIEFNIATAKEVFDLDGTVDTLTVVFHFIDNNNLLTQDINSTLKLSPQRGDYKIYQNVDGSIDLKSFFVNKLQLTEKLNIDDYFAIQKTEQQDHYNLYYIKKNESLASFYNRVNLKKEYLNETPITLSGKKDNYTEEELKDILLDYLNRENVGNIPTPFISFGFEFGNSFENINATKFIESANITTANAAYYLGQGIALYKATSREIYGIRFGEEKVSSINNVKHPLQQIFYGAPGTGKSREIKEQTKDDDTVIRTTFHPDSDYSTFVGCYKPTMSDKPKPIYGFDANGNTVEAKDSTGAIVEERKIEYKFVQQAFTKAYIQAWKKMCDTSLWAKKAVAIPPTGKAATPYNRTSNIGNVKVFDRPEDDVTLLASEEKTALLEVDNFDFPFDGIKNFGELHDKIKVIVTDLPTDEQNKRYVRNNDITYTAEQIRELFKNYREKHKDINPNIIPILLRRIAEKLKRGLYIPEDFDELAKYDGGDITINVNESNSLLGLYDPTTKTVYLFKKNIGNNVDLLRAVYIHEMFHAYYDSGDKYIPKIEEPIVECNTLCFLELFNPNYCNSYLESVRDEQYTASINYYGFGAHLFENRSLDWMRLYQNAYKHIDDTSIIVNDYKGMFSPIYPFGNEDNTRNLLYNILNPQYDEISIPKQARQYLIIEEINRGNCAQIFGDLFQLLDRKDGYSEYPIEADDDLRKELENEFVELKLDAAVEQKINSIFKENYRDGITDKILKGKLLVLPKNLFIWATMNTSDQSLFPMDSAFKRRWDWEYQPIVNANKGWQIMIEGYKLIDWWAFVERINYVVADLTKSEDKQLGYFFCMPDKKAEETDKEFTVISARRFVQKVIFYLWNDVFKDYSYEPACCNKNDKADKLMYADFYSKTNGKEIDTNTLVQFLKQLNESCTNFKSAGFIEDLKEEEDSALTGNEFNDENAGIGEKSSSHEDDQQQE